MLELWIQITTGQYTIITIGTITVAAGLHQAIAGTLIRIARCAQAPNDAGHNEQRQPDADHQQ